VLIARRAAFCAPGAPCAAIGAAPAAGLPVPLPAPRIAAARPGALGIRGRSDACVRTLTTSACDHMWALAVRERAEHNSGRVTMCSAPSAAYNTTRSMRSRGKRTPRTRGSFRACGAARGSCRT
jgi:hypothetical protein